MQKDYEELALSVMNIVDRLVHKTNVHPSVNNPLENNKRRQITYFPLFSVTHIHFYFQEKIESATDVLKEILKPVVDDVEEISWPPRDPEALQLMEKVSINL